MKTPEPNDESVRELWRRRKLSTSAARPLEEAESALEEFLAASDSADDEAIARLLAHDPALLDTVVAAHRAAGSMSGGIPDGALARAQALVRAPERRAVSTWFREWLAAQWTLPAAARGAAFAAALALVCTAGVTAGKRNRPADLAEFSVVPGEWSGGWAFDVGALFSNGGGR